MFVVSEVAQPEQACPQPVSAGLEQGMALPRARSWTTVTGGSVGKVCVMFVWPDTHRASLADDRWG